MLSCPECPGSQFSTDAKLQDHILKYHHSINSTNVNFECASCSSRFLTVKGLKQHQLHCKGDIHNLQSPSTSSQLDYFGTSNAPSDGDDFNDEQENANRGPENVAPDIHVDQTILDSSSCDDNEDGDNSETIKDILQQKVAAFLLHIKDGCNATQTIINEIIKGMDDVIELHVEWIKDRLITKFEKAQVLSLQDAAKELDLMKGLSVFQGCQNLVSYLESTGRFVKPKKLVFKSVNVPRSDGSVQQKDEEFAYIIPFADQLANILSCKDVLHCVQNPKPAPTGSYHSLLDGSFYKNHPITQKHKNPLCFVLHSDGAELTDLGSARAGEHGITNISWTLANIYPELRSTDRSINLLATVKTKWLNHERLGLILEDFKSVMIKLASDEGLTLTINNEEMVFHGFLLIVCGDHPAQGFIGGFKESVTAEKPCRRCLAARGVYLKETDIAVFILRTEDAHKLHVEAVEAYVPVATRKRKRGANEEHPDPSIRYGVNRRSHLMSVPHFQVTSCLVQDIMHLGPEGLLSHVCRLVLSHVVFKKKSLTLEVIEQRIREFSTYLRVDRPNSKITDKHLKDGLRQSSAQMRKLSILLPFVLRKKEGEVYTFAGDIQYLNLLILILKIMNLAMAFELNDSDVDSLKKLISDFHKLILEIDPGIQMGKLHFLHHLPEQISLFGVLRQQACFRFEAHFSFFKRMNKITKNTVNSLLTLSVRHQTRQCHYIMKPTFLYTGHKFGKVQDFPVSVHEPDIKMLQVAMGIQNLQRIQETSRVTIHSATFTSGRSKVLIDSTTPLPKFAQVSKIYIVNGKLGFVCENWKTIQFEKDLHAYEVQPRKHSKTYIDVEKLHFKQEVLSIRAENKWLLIPENHRALLS